MRPLTSQMARGEGGKAMARSSRDENRRTAHLESIRRCRESGDLATAERERAKVDYREFAVPRWLQKALGQGDAAQPDAEIGLPYIHGVEPREHPLHRPLQNFEGGTLLVGTTQSGKGVASANLISPVTPSLERQDCISLLDRPICEADHAADAIRWPVIEPDRDVRGFQSVLVELANRLSLPGFITEDGRPRYRD